MKSFGKNQLKILTSLLACVLSLFSALSLTFSWFSYNRNVRGGGFHVGVKQQRDILDCVYYLANPDKPAYTFDPVNAQDATLGKYDILENRYQLLVQVILEENVDAVRVRADSATTYFLGNPNEQKPLLPARADHTGLPDDEGKGYTNALSNVVSMCVLSKDELGTDGASYTLESLPQSNRMSSFIDKTAGVNTIPSPSVFLQRTPGEDVIATEPVQYQGQNRRCVWLLLTYDSVLVSMVFAANIGNAALENDATGERVIPFRCDFTIDLIRVENP